MLVVAAPAEARAVLSGLGGDPALAERAWEPHRVGERFSVVVSGIGKANAAGAAAHALPRGAEAGAVLSVGVAGALPGSGLRLGDVVAATASVFADEGIETPQGFRDCAAMGFPLGTFPGSAVPLDGRLAEALALTADALGPVATVSTCSGTAALAEQVRRRTGAIAEAMEGAAVALVAARVGLPAGELRVISNTTGDRPTQVWDLRRALVVLNTVIGRL